jgi:nitrous oxide reductase accessory protein NosL
MKNPMKNKIISLFTAATLALCSGVALAGQMEGHEGHKHGAAAVATHADVKKHQSCPHCGMDRDKFAHSRMLVTYADGTAVGVCSICCVATELKASKGKAVKSVEVGDYTTRKLIDTEKATWVIGGSKKGVMTQNPKWAFTKKGDAEAFIKKNGGTLGTYKEALALAEKE